MTNNYRLIKPPVMRTEEISVGVDPYIGIEETGNVFFPVLPKVKYDKVVRLAGRRIMENITIENFPYDPDDPRKYDEVKVDGYTFYGVIPVNENELGTECVVDYWKKDEELHNDR